MNYKIFYGGFFAGIVLLFQLAGLSGPAHALKIYSERTGNKPCSTCHARSGLVDGTMRPLNSVGDYYRTYGQLPPSAQPSPYPPVTQPQPQPNPYPPVTQPQPNPYPPVNPTPPANDHVAWCRRKYRSYNPSTDTYRGYDGYTHRCISPWARGGQAPVRPVQPVRPVRPVYPRPVPRRNLTCNQAVNKVRRMGYYNVRAKTCFDFGRYTIYAEKRGRRWRLRVRASNGDVYKITPR